jgi:hypothetical protein
VREYSVITFAAAHNMAMLPTEGCVAFGPGPEGESRPVHVVLESDGKLQHQLHQVMLRKGRFMKGKGVVYQVGGCSWLAGAGAGWLDCSWLAGLQLAAAPRGSLHLA